MLIINKEFIERCSDEYDRRARGTNDQIVEADILNWLSTQGLPKFLNKEYFILLGRWKTPRYQATRETNDEHNIIETTRSAYLAKNDLNKLKILIKLKGVGIAVASTILYYLQPDKFAIYDYHVRNTLNKAGKLSKGAEGDSSKVWLEYTRIIRELSTVYNKTLRELEKALFAHDKWGCGENEADDKEREMNEDNGKEGLRVRLPAQKRELIKRVAEDEFGVNASTLAQIWIIERLHKYQDQSVTASPTQPVSKEQRLAREEPPNGHWQGLSDKPVTQEIVKEIKQQLANKYIEEPQEKCIFLKTRNDDIHDWGCYLAGLVLTQKGKTPFQRADIKIELKILLGDIYEKNYVKESTVLPADVCHNCAPSSQDFQFPCLEAVNKSGKRYTYKWIGFKQAIKKKFGSNELNNMLADC